MRTLNSASLRFTLYVLALFALIIYPSTAASAQQPTPSDDNVNAIASRLYCPVCENTPLDVCPTEACRQWRDLIRQMLSEGKSSEEITQYFVDNYGARVLATPLRKGVNWLVYILPPAAFVAGAILLFRALRSWKRKGQEPATKTESATAVSAKSTADEYVLRLEEELRKRK